MRRPAIALGLSLLLAFASVAFGQYGNLGDFKVLKPEDKEHVKSTPAPKGAVVLFDGKSLDGWVYKDKGKDRKDRPAKWKLLDDGVMQVQGGDILEVSFTGQGSEFSDVKLTGLADFCFDGTIEI